MNEVTFIISKSIPHHLFVLEDGPSLLLALLPPICCNRARYKRSSFDTPRYSLCSIPA